MKKKLIALMLALALCLELTPALAAESGIAFTDVAADAWYAPYVDYVARDGVMIGTGGGEFSPEKELTQAECLTLAYRLYDLLRGQENVVETAPGGWGSATHWWTDICYTIEKRELTGNFDPADFNNRQAARSFFARALYAAAGDYLEKINEVEAIPDLSRTMDDGSVTDLYREQVYALYEAGILNGMDDVGTFAADKSLTRAEAATMVARVLEPSLRVGPPQVQGITETILELLTTGFESNGRVAFFVVPGSGPYSVPMSWKEYGAKILERFSALDWQEGKGELEGSFRADLPNELFLFYGSDTLSYRFEKFFHAKGAEHLVQDLIDLYPGPELRYYLMPGVVGSDKQQAAKAFMTAFEEYYLSSGAVTDFKLKSVELLEVDSDYMSGPAGLIFQTIYSVRPTDPSLSYWQEKGAGLTQDGWVVLSNTIVLSRNGDGVYEGDGRWRCDDVSIGNCRT